MNNDELRKWNDQLDELRRYKIKATKWALKSRGLRRAVALLFARFFGWVESLGKRLRNEQMRDDYDPS